MKLHPSSAGYRHTGGHRYRRAIPGGPRSVAASRSREQVGDLGRVVEMPKPHHLATPIPEVLDRHAVVCRQS